MYNLLRSIKWKLLVPLFDKIGIGAGFVRGMTLSGGSLKYFSPQSSNGKSKETSPLANSKSTVTMLRWIAQGLSVDAAEQWAFSIKQENPEKTKQIDWARGSAYLDLRPEVSLAVTRDILDSLSDRDVKNRRQMANRFIGQGIISETIQVLSCIEWDEATGRTINKLKAQKELLENGYRKMPEPNSVSKARHKKVLYMLHNSLPHTSGGYATRSHGLVKGIIQQGWTVECVTKVGYPELYKDIHGRMPAFELVDGIKYHRFPIKSAMEVRSMDAIEFIDRNSRELEKLARRLGSEVIHSVSNHVNGLAAASAARNIGVKSVYEVRGLWELTRYSRQPSYYGSEHYRMVERMERDACLAVDSVITITQGLKNLLVKRGVPAEKIHVVPNGVDTDRFVPQECDWTLKDQLGLTGKYVVGFIGSMPEYEGLDYLMRSLRELVSMGIDDIHVLLIGDGSALSDLKSLVRRFDLIDYVTFTGRVPHEKVESYYSIIDLLVFPRKRQPVTELVSPLKPFEAMASGKAILASNVGAIEEFVDDGNNGFLFEADSVTDLTQRVSDLRASPEVTKAVASQARDWVVNNRDWRVASAQVVEIYESLK
ncbi:glycosyltransferase family 4 protein [Spiribacter roseus]|uniref:glycosyltransferase family 4 protein n=1 Tax=Spiribacter roseus TaxID=1855875 RepID=UPI00132FE4D4|nr:glycosyltransferase family 4 protein [Spiribacter roseus]